MTRLVPLWRDVTGYHVDVQHDVRSGAYRYRARPWAPWRPGLPPRDWQVELRVFGRCLARALLIVAAGYVIALGASAPVRLDVIEARILASERAWVASH